MYAKRLMAAAALMLLPMGASMHAQSAEQGSGPGASSPTSGAVVGSPQRVRISGGLMAQQIVHREQPHFPDEARQQHINGTVVFRVIIGTDGTVKDVAPVSGPSVLIPAYTDAVRQWTYKPYLLNGKPVEVETMISLTLATNGG